MVQKNQTQAETLSGSPQPNFVGYAKAPIISKRDPTTADTGYGLGQSWVNNVGSRAFTLVNVAAGVATWIEAVTPTGPLNTLTADSGGAISPVGGNINLFGTTNEITTTGSGHQIAFSIPANFIAPGSITSTTALTAGTTFTAVGLSTLAALTQIGTTNINASGAAVTTIGTGGTGAVHIGNTTGNTAVTGSLTATTTLHANTTVSSGTTMTAGTGFTSTTGNITATAGNLIATAGQLQLNGAASKVVINAGTPGSASVGTATLTLGTVTVSTTAVTASSKIFVSYNNLTSALACALDAPTASIVVGTSFVINSQDTTDSTSTVNYWIIN